ncbi:unnamed protein product [Meganyctiphanes norvegica]|uniref:Uncharacterized protein n=1 Tax=Meganyctiphanes norvegica TaxID=48144 RepID=A0AAV2R8U4_MEGNR
MLQIQDNWNFMLSQHEISLKNQDAKFYSADGNSMTRVTKPNTLEDNDIHGNSEQNIDFKPQIMKEENSNNSTDGSTYYKFDIIEKQLKNENFQDFHWSSQNQSNVNYEKVNEDYSDKSTEFSQYKMNEIEGIDTTESSTVYQCQKDTDKNKAKTGDLTIVSHINGEKMNEAYTDKATELSQYNLHEIGGIDTTKTSTISLCQKDTDMNKAKTGKLNIVSEVNKSRNEIFPHSFFTDIKYKTTEIVSNKNEIIPAKMSDEKSMFNYNRRCEIESDEVELFV